jgi:DNA-directed RNA polymerase subunit M/transcription elongation factor TFIIS
MSLIGSYSFLSCPSCGELIMPSGIQIGKEPEFWITECSHCRKKIEVRRDFVTGKLIAKKVRPS